MALHNNLKLLFISFYLIISFRLATSQLSTDVSPSTQPNSSPSPSPGPTSESHLNHVSYPPSISDPTSDSVSPDANEHSESDEALSTNDVDPKVKEMCDSTDYPSLCLDTVVPLLEGKTDVPSALESAISAGTKLAQFAVSMAKEIAEKPGTPPELVSILNDCKDSFDDAVYNFQNAMNAFPERDIGTMNTMLSAVITDIGDCEDAFSGLGTESPLFDYLEKLTNMTSNCLALAALLN